MPWLVTDAICAPIKRQLTYLRSLEPGLALRGPAGSVSAAGGVGRPGEWVGRGRPEPAPRWASTSRLRPPPGFRRVSRGAQVLLALGNRAQLAAFPQGSPEPSWARLLPFFSAFCRGTGLRGPSFCRERSSRDAQSGRSCQHPCGQPGPRQCGPVKATCPRSINTRTSERRKERIGQVPGVGHFHLLIGKDPRPHRG